MGTAAHLGIRLADYDREIRRFIPGYEEMLEAAVAALPHRPGALVVECGVGSGALAERYLRAAPRAKVVGIDGDTGMLALARQRLPDARRCRLLAADFTQVELPRCDGIAGTLAWHHVPSVRRKLTMYRGYRQALRPGGVLVAGDCYPATEPGLAAAQRAAWRQHMRGSFTAARTRAWFRQWAAEDTYMTLEVELAMLRRAGFTAEVYWRQGSFAVLRALTM